MARKLPKRSVKRSVRAKGGSPGIAEMRAERLENFKKELMKLADKMTATEGISPKIINDFMRLSNNLKKMKSKKKK